MSFLTHDGARSEWIAKYKFCKDSIEDQTNGTDRRQNHNRKITNRTGGSNQIAEGIDEEASDPKGSSERRDGGIFQVRAALQRDPQSLGHAGQQRNHQWHQHLFAIVPK